VEWIVTSSWYANERYAAVRTGAERTYRVGRAAAELAISADGARKQQGIGAVRGGADVALKYRNLKAEAGFRTLPIEEKLFKVAGDTLTVTGGVLSAIALPTMAKKTATSFQELKTLIHDPTATTDARLNKVEEMSRAGAGTIFATQGVVAGAKGTIGIMARSEGIARVVSKVSEGPLMKFVGSPLGKALNILLPVADGAVLVGELIATRRTFLDPAATGSSKLRKVLDLSLAGVKVAFWCLPGAKALKSLYTIASFGQLMLTLRDYWPQIQPNIVKVAKAVGWGIVHPIEAMGKIAEGTVKGVGWVFQKGAQLVGWTASKILHPVETWNNAWTEISAWGRAYYEATNRQVSSWFQKPVPGQAPAPQLAFNAPAPVAPMPYAPAPTAPVPAVPAPMAPAPAVPAASAPAPVVVAQAPAVAPAPPPVAPPPPPPAPAPAAPPAPAPAPAPMLADATTAPAAPVAPAPAAATPAVAVASVPAAPVVMAETDALARIRQAAANAAASA
jgi:hypothetical protein